MTKKVTRLRAEERNELPKIDLISRQYKGKDFIFSRFDPSVFGKNVSYGAHRRNMQEEFWNSNRYPQISFRPATTSKSILAAHFDKPYIDHGRTLCLGYVVQTEEGIFANPPLDREYPPDPITDKEKLKKLLNGTKPVKVNGHLLYIVPSSEEFRDFGFAEKGTYQSGWYRGVRSCLSYGGIARVLEHTREPAVILKSLYRKSEFPGGADNYGFYPPSWERENGLKVVHLLSRDPTFDAAGDPEWPRSLELFFHNPEKELSDKNDRRVYFAYGILKK